MNYRNKLMNLSLIALAVFSACSDEVENLSLIHISVMIAFVFHSFQGDGLDGAGRDVVARLELHRRKHVPEKNRHARCLAHFIAVGHHKVLLVGYLFGYLIKQFRVFDVAIFRDGQVLRVVGIPGKKSQFFAGRPVVWCPGRCV